MDNCWIILLIKVVFSAKIMFQESSPYRCRWEGMYSLKGFFRLLFQMVAFFFITWNWNSKFQYNMKCTMRWLIVYIKKIFLLEEQEIFLFKSLKWWRTTAQLISKNYDKNRSRRNLPIPILNSYSVNYIKFQ